MCAMAIRSPLIMNIFDITNNQVLPRDAVEAMSQVVSTVSTFWPYWILATMRCPTS